MSPSLRRHINALLVLELLTRYRSAYDIRYIVKGSSLDWIKRAGSLSFAIWLIDEFLAFHFMYYEGSLKE